MKPCFLMVARWFALCLFGLESSVALAAEDYMAEALAASRRAPLQIAAYQKEVNQAVKDSTRETQKEAEDEKDIKETKEIKKMPAILIFVSFSMPEQSLEAFLRDAKKVHASVVIRGLVNNSFQQTLQRMKKLIQASGGNGVELNPLWFKRLGIQRVPTVAVVPPESVCLTQAICQKETDFDVVSGDIPLAASLRLIRDRGTSGADARAMAQAAVSTLQDIAHA